VCATREYGMGDVFLARLEPDCEARLGQPTLVSAGSYDDFDRAIVFRGEWTRDRNFAEPDGHTISYSDAPGAEAALAFEGTALTYFYTKAPNRGIAEVVIDEKPAGELDLYSPTVEWRSRTRFCCFAPGHHLATLRVTGRSHANASGRFVDLDSFVVE